MGQSEVRAEDLLDRVVRNSYGRPIGRLQDLRVEPDGDDYLVTEFLLGPLVRFPRLRAFAEAIPTFRALGIGKKRRPRPVPWQWMDLTDPARPRLVGSEAAEA